MSCKDRIYTEKGKFLVISKSQSRCLALSSSAKTTGNFFLLQAHLANKKVIFFPTFFLDKKVGKKSRRNDASTSLFYFVRLANSK
jgi:hypothetical protein